MDDRTPLPCRCYVCDWWGYAPAAFQMRDGHLVCRDVQACTDRVMSPPTPMYHEEFITDEALDRIATKNIFNAVMTVRPELRGADIQVCRDNMRGGWKVRAKR